MIEWVGLALLVLVGLGIIFTGLPAAIVLVTVASLGAISGLIAGTIEFATLGALPSRLINLFENDLLQALPLYVTMGLLLDRLPVADALYRASNALLPLFFVVTGLSVNVTDLNGTAFAVLALLTAIAGFGKLVPGYLASRLGGLDRKDAATTAALVNTRGLTELIALNVGLSSGLIGQRLFSVLVLMAVLTTVTTAPLLTLIRPRTMAEPPDAGSPGPREPDRLAGLGGGTMHSPEGKGAV